MTSTVRSAVALLSCNYCAKGALITCDVTDEGFPIIIFAKRVKPRMDPSLVPDFEGRYLENERRFFKNTFYLENERRFFKNNFFLRVKFYHQKSTCQNVAVDL